MDILIKLATGKKIGDTDIANALYDVCETEHSSCNDNCPVYFLNGSRAPGNEKPFNTNRGCDCFKNGQSMLNFIRQANK